MRAILVDLQSGRVYNKSAQKEFLMCETCVGCGTRVDISFYDDYGEWMCRFCVYDRDESINAPEMELDGYEYAGLPEPDYYI